MTDANPFMPDIELNIESEEIVAKGPKLKRPWTVVMSFPTVYFVPKGLSPQQITDDRYWPRDESGVPTKHKPATLAHHFAFGEEVLVKDIYDYVWRRVQVMDVRQDLVYAMDDDVMANIHPDPENGVWCSHGLVTMSALRTMEQMLRDGHRPTLAANEESA